MIVSSWNEWDPLKHVIVGKADNCHIPAPEPALDAKVPEDSDMKGSWGRRTQETIDRANELLDNFSNQLENLGITVDRPTPVDFSESVKTPDFRTILTDRDFSEAIVDTRSTAAEKALTSTCMMRSFPTGMTRV